MITDPKQGAPTAVLLYSGGLDSILAAEVLRRAGVQVVLLQHESVFYPAGKDGYTPPCPRVVRDISEEMVELLRDPEYGMGSNANPCLDCKQMMYGLAQEEAERLGADFIATGEVLGQRPMSQNKGAFRRMEKGAGLVDRVVRPLSGKLLPPTEAERQGLIRREEMLDIEGRSRKRQMALAEKWGITDYPTPAGGCRLTDPNYAERVFALKRMGFLTVAHLRVARHGRLFELGESTFVLVGRNEEDNRSLREAAPADSLLLELEDHPGPLACLAGEPTKEALRRARELVIRYSRFDGLPRSAVLVWPADEPRPAPEEPQ